MMPGLPPTRVDADMQLGEYAMRESDLLTQEVIEASNRRRMETIIPPSRNTYRVTSVGAGPEDYMTRMLAQNSTTQRMESSEGSTISGMNNTDSSQSFGTMSQNNGHVTTIVRTLIPPKKIGWSHLPVRKVTAERVRDYAIETGGRDRISREFLEEKEIELKQVRKHLMAFARQHIHRFFLEGLKEMNITHLATMEDIQSYWRQNCKDPNVQEAIAHMLYGYFDKRVHWEVNLEREYMRQKNWVYMDRVNDSKDKKGCIAKVISEVKVEQTRRIQQAGKKEGIYVTIKRQGPLQRRDKNRKRQKGNFYVRTAGDLNGITTNVNPLTAMFQLASVNLGGINGDSLTTFTTQFLNLVNTTQALWSERSNISNQVNEEEDDDESLSDDDDIEI